MAGRRVLVVEDGPTVTHGGLAHAAGLAAARAAGAVIVDPRPWAAPAVRAVYDAYPHLGPVLPAIGEKTAMEKPVVRVRYEFADAPWPGLESELEAFLAARDFA